MAISQAVSEATTARHDEKPRGLWYLAALRFLNKTWGKVTEIGDFYEVFMNNILLPHMEINLNGEYIIVNEGQKLAELPVRFQTVILKMMMQQKVDNVLTLGVSHEDITINFEGLIVDLFMMEALDASIGLLMKTERNIINEAGLRDFFDYENRS